jgi:hypothetical protein
MILNLFPDSRELRDTNGIRKTKNGAFQMMMIHSMTYYKYLQEMMWKCQYL